MSSDRGGQLGELVKLYRTARMLTQRQLAAAAGIGLGTLRDLEQGRHGNAHWQTVESVAVALDIDQRQRAALLLACRPGAAVTRGGSALRRGDTGELARIEILGPLTAWLAGTALPLGSMRQRAVLGLLALHDGAGVHRDTIIDAVWGARPPATAPTQTHGYVSRLRKLLSPRGGDPPELIARAGARYRLQTGRGQLDLTSFSQLLGRADRVAAQAGAERACDLYEQALALWHGDVLADIDPLRGHPAVAELAHRRTDAVLRYADLTARTGRPHRALGPLRELCVREPFNEAAHARLMIALAATGQQAAALDVFGALRRRLIDELGISPGPLLAEAQAQVLGQRINVGFATASGAGPAASRGQVPAGQIPAQLRAQVNDLQTRLGYPPLV